MVLRLSLILLCIVGLAAPAGAEPAVRVETTLRDGQVLVSFDVTEGVSDEIRAAIQSGLPTTFTYDVALRESSRWWLDRTIATARVSALVRYDNLTRRYQITLIEDGRVEEVRTTDDEATAHGWMTTFRARRLSTHRLERDGDYYVRVQAQTRPSLLAWPWGPETVLGSVRFRFRP